MLEIYKHRREREQLAARRIAELENQITSLRFAVSFLDNESNLLDQENQRLEKKNEQLREIIDALLRYTSELQQLLRCNDQRPLDIAPLVF